MFDKKLIKQNIKKTYRLNKNTLTILDKFEFYYNIRCLNYLGYPDKDCIELIKTNFKDY